MSLVYQSRKERFMKSLVRRALLLPLVVMALFFSFYAASFCWGLYDTKLYLTPRDMVQMVRTSYHEDLKAFGIRQEEEKPRKKGGR
jgi:hypothetical protein